MEKSKEELINGINELTPADPFPDEIFYKIFEIEDHVERTQFVEALKNYAPDCRPLVMNPGDMVVLD